MSREDRVKLRTMLLYIADCMALVNDLERTGNCNNCGNRNRCDYLPELGTTVRWNCPLWKECDKE